MKHDHLIVQVLICLAMVFALGYALTWLNEYQGESAKINTTTNKCVGEQCKF